MSETSTHRSLAKGLLAGLIAGLVATAAKSVAEKLYPPCVHEEAEPPEFFAEAEEVVGYSSGITTKAMNSEAIHWGFGVAAGAAYGALAEFYPAATAKDGASFGLALMALTHQTALPATELSALDEKQTAREHTSEAATHLVYGVVAEGVRSFVRGLLG